MKNIYSALLAAGLLWPGAAAAAYEDEGLSEAVISTGTEKNHDDEDGQTVIQEDDEDLAAFVTDYIRKDTQLKGAFFVEEKNTKKILKLFLFSVNPKPVNGGSGVKKVAAVFKDAAGKKYAALFHLQNGPWGGLDIFRLEIKQAAGKTSKAN